MQRKWRLKGPNALGSGMFRRAAIVVTTVVALAGGGVVIAESASAHTGSPEPSCTGLKVAFTNYNDQKDNAGAYKNIIKVTVDGSSLENTKFGASFSKTYTWTQYASHHWKVEVFAWDDPNGSQGFTKTFEGDQTACQTQIAIPATPAIDDACGVGNAHWIPQADTDALDWTFGSDNTTATVATKGNNVFTDGTTFHDYGVAPETNTDDCTVLAPTGSVQTDCTGEIKYVLDNRASNVSVTYETVVNGKSKQYQVKAGVLKTVVRHGNPGDKAVLWGPGDVQLGKTTVPRKCAVVKPTGSIHTSCTGRVVATLNNKASNRRYVYSASTSSKTAAQAWRIAVKANHVRSFHFGGKKFKPGTVVKLHFAGKTVKDRVPARCNVPSTPPDTGMRTHPTAKATGSRLIVPAIGVNNRIVQVGLTKGGAQAVTHSVSDVFPLA